MSLLDLAAEIVILISISLVAASILFAILCIALWPLWGILYLIVLYYEKKMQNEKK